MYLPSDDSFFFAEFLKNYFSKLKKSKKELVYYLDLGSGSGILSETAIKEGIKKVLASDIDNDSIKYVKSKKIKIIKSNLFSSPKLKNKKFDIITFNAPYLPEDKQEPKDSRLATTGGKCGDEVSLRFIKQAKKHLKTNGRIFLLISSLTPTKRINKFKPKIVARKKIFFEELIILQFDNSIDS